MPTARTTLRSLLLPFVLLLGLTTVPGCASFEAFTASAPAATRIAVQYAVLKTLEAHPDAPQKATAIVATVREAKTFLRTNNGQAPTDHLAQAVRAKLDIASLAPADQLLADTLIAAIAFELDQRALSPAEQVVYINDALEWIEQTATLFIAQEAYQP